MWNRWNYTELGLIAIELNIAVYKEIVTFGKFHGVILQNWNMPFFKLLVLNWKEMQKYTNFDNTLK